MPRIFGRIGVGPQRSDDGRNIHLDLLSLLPLHVIEICSSLRGNKVCRKRRISLSNLQIQALNDLYRRADGREGYGFGKRTISGGGTWLAAGDEEGLAARKTKKNMAIVRCKACGQVIYFRKVSSV